MSDHFGPGSFGEFFPLQQGNPAAELLGDIATETTAIEDFIPASPQSFSEQTKGLTDFISRFQGRIESLEGQNTRNREQNAKKLEEINAIKTDVSSRIQTLVEAEQQGLQKGGTKKSFSEMNLEEFKKTLFPELKDKKLFGFIPFQTNNELALDRELQTQLSTIKIGAENQRITDSREEERRFTFGEAEGADVLGGITPVFLKYV